MDRDALTQIVAVYVSWNTRDELAASLETLLGPGGGGPQVVVVDNASSDGTVEMVRERFPQVHVIANPDNRGFATAFNQGWRASERPFVLQMNPDTVLPPDALTVLHGCLAANPELGAVAPVLVDDRGEDTQSARPFPPLTLKLLGDELPMHGESMALEGCPDAAAIHWFMGACGLIRREALAATDGFDEGFFLYSEDIDWGLRAWRAGRRLAQVASLQVVHHGSCSSEQVSSWLTMMRRHDGYFRYLTQAHGPWAARGNYLWWLARAGLATLLLAPPSLFRPGLRPRLRHEAGRVGYCLTHLGRPFLLARFGRNHAPRASHREETRR